MGSLIRVYELVTAYETVMHHTPLSYTIILHQAKFRLLSFIVVQYHELKVTCQSCCCYGCADVSPRTEWRVQN